MSRIIGLCSLLVTALLGVSVAAVRSIQNKGPVDVTKFARGTELFQDVPVGELATIKIEDYDQTTTLAKGTAGWVIKDSAEGYEVERNSG